MGLKGVIMDHVSQVEEPRVIKIFEDVRKNVNIDCYMPDLNYDKLLNRDFVENAGKV